MSVATTYTIQAAQNFASDNAATIQRQASFDAAAADALNRVRTIADTMRRTRDVAGSLLLLGLVLPLMLVVACLIKLDSRGPTLYRQDRVGLLGKIFTVLKFRSMRIDAEADGPCWAAQRDHRVTRIDRVIRACRIDELPQLFNVLRGEMSLVGPRPERPFFTEKLASVIQGYHKRTRVLPGITGLAQVSYAYGASVDDARAKMVFDLYYLRNRTMFLDLRILAATVKVVLCGTGAH
jgi:lipopolysaccharide/colanic/teichoic acid biosynthesis glycosyltransferase